ncbi:MAG: phosphatidylglycerol lysyltransferase domain-containing protein [Actinobacteria bacterium]|nr:phosphatidylglycerol lysyltransferase domain-containing protein [Actinomycetota bacterium]
MKLKESVPLIIGRVTYVFGLLDILANVLRPFRAPAKRVDSFFPVAANSTAFATAVFTGVILIIIARGLIRRKKRARNLAIILLVANMVSDIFRYHYHPVQVAYSFILLISLIVFRNEFYAISDPTTNFAPLKAFLYSFIFVIASGIFMIYFRHKHELVGSPTFSNVLLTVIEGMVWVSGPVEFSSERISNTVDVVLGVLGIFTVLVPLWLYFRRVAPIERMSQEDLNHVKDLINHDGDQDSLGYFATRLDKSVVWSNNKKAGIAYRVQGGVMLASGEPFGEYSLWGEVIDNFLEIAKKYAWTPAVMGGGDRGGEVWVERAGMLAIDIGDEAVIKVSDFSLEGRAMGNVRHMVNRIKKKGYTTSFSRFGDLSDEQQQALRGLAKKWRYGVPERGFSMSMDRFGTEIDADCFITLAEEGGSIKGFLYFVPWTKTKLSLDRMQRDKDAEQGITELMIAETAEYARTNGITHISLNFATFRSLFERAEKISAGPITRSTRNIIRFFSNWFQVESLYRFNAKFQPEWQTRYVIYPKASDLPKVGWAALRAEKFISSFRKHSV